MYSSPKRDVTVPLYRKAFLIWIALSSSLVFYAAICHVVGGAMKMNTAMSDVLTMLEKILFVVSLLFLIFSSSLRKRMLSAQVQIAVSREGEDDESYLSRLVSARYMSAVIIMLALSESVGMVGAVLFFLGAGFTTLYVFLAVSAIALALNRPRPEEIELLYERMERSI